MDIIDTINRTGQTVEQELLDATNRILGGPSNSNKALPSGVATICDPKPIRTIVNQFSSGGLLSANESTAFVVIKGAAALAIGQGSTVILEPLVIPPGFYFRVEGITLRVDDEAATVDVACTITPAQKDEVAGVDAWLPLGGTGPQPQGLVLVGSNLGFIVANGGQLNMPIPGGLQMNFVFFRNTGSANTGNCQAVVVGTLMRDNNYEQYRTAV